jgi:hypothetical protein
MVHDSVTTVLAGGCGPLDDGDELPPAEIPMEGAMLTRRPMFAGLILVHSGTLALGLAPAP